MIRTIKRAAVLAAIPAALAISLTTPANAATVVGTAFSQPGQIGAPAALQDVGTTCTPIYPMSVLTAQSARILTTPNRAVIFYATSGCGGTTIKLQPGDAKNLGFEALAYQTTAPS